MKDYQRQRARLTERLRRKERRLRIIILDFGWEGGTPSILLSRSEGEK
jgi:hypothetical protein